MTCRAAIAVLAEYLDATLDAAAARALQAHLAGCEECRVYLATYRRTVDAVRTFLLAQLRGED